MTDQSKSGPLLEKILDRINPVKMIKEFAIRDYERDMAKVDENTVLTVSSKGKMLWNPNAEAMIADDSLWDEYTAGNRHLLRILFTQDKQVETARKSLVWYQDEAAALARHMAAGTEGAITACVRVLSLDGGKRATEALVALKEIRGTE